MARAKNAPRLECSALRMLRFKMARVNNGPRLILTLIKGGVFARAPQCLFSILLAPLADAPLHHFVKILYLSRTVNLVVLADHLFPQLVELRFALGEHHSLII